MCGITGVAYRDRERPIDAALLARMTAILRHRGPDSEGFHRAPGIGLGVRRLSIVDLSTGDQPIANEDGSIIVVCNGEIYNHVELRETLVARGHRFRTASDVEAIVHLYEDHGADFVLHLRGMFGLALWDAPRRRLILARDPLGIKPLHYAITADGLYFGSEQKAILASGAVSPDLDLRSLRQVFEYGHALAPRTLVEGIRRLGPGCRLTWLDGSERIEAYWEPSFPMQDEYDLAASEAAWAERLRERLTESVRLHLRSDVPVGAWLSGGIDSSSVAALMSRALPGPIPSFTLRFDDPDFDELHERRALDDFPAYRLEGHRPVCRPADLEKLPSAIWHAEDLLAGGVVVGQLVVAASTAKRVKVVLTGEGADEVLGGYSWYPTLRVLDPLFRLPASIRRSLGRVPPIRRRWPGAAGLLRGSREMTFQRYLRSISHLPGAGHAETLFSPQIREASRAGTEEHEGPREPPGFRAWHPFAQLQYFDLKHRLPDAVVLGLDRASMAHSVEARVPFLDPAVVELCARIPPRVKMKWLREKDVLRRAMSALLPEEIVRRRKHPMRVPIEDWLRGSLPDFAAELVSESSLRDTGYFDPSAVADMLRRHRDGEPRLGHTLSAVIGAQLWDRIFRRQPTGSGVAP
jgi:asparagine synthase (glutamine-hydrolysing)